MGSASIGASPNTAGLPWASSSWKLTEATAVFAEPFDHGMRRLARKGEFTVPSVDCSPNSVLYWSTGCRDWGDWGALALPQASHPPAPARPPGAWLPYRRAARLGLNDHLLAVIQGEAEPIGDVTANDRLIATCRQPSRQS